MSIIKDLTNFNFEKISLSEPSKMNINIFFSKLLYLSNKLQIQTPKCKLKYNNRDIDNNKNYLIYLIFENRNIIEWFIKFEQKIIELLFINRESWFEGEFTIQDFRNFYYKSFKIDNVENEKTLYKLSCKYDKNVYNIKTGYNIYNKNGDEFKIENIDNNDVICVLNINGINLTNSSFELSILIKEILVFDENTKHIIIHDNYEISDVESEISNIDTDLETDLETDNGISSDTESYIDSESDTESYISKKNNVPNNSELKEIDLEIIESFPEIKSKKSESNPEHLEIIDIEIDNLKSNSLEKVNLKSTNDIYMEIYKQSKKKYKNNKKNTLDSLIEMKKIREKYLPHDFIDSSDDEIV
jgi:hypothetical protein